MAILFSSVQRVSIGRTLAEVCIEAHVHPDVHSQVRRCPRTLTL